MLNVVGDVVLNARMRFGYMGHYNDDIGLSPFGRYYLGYLDNRTEARIEVVSGAYMFVRGEAFRSVGGFDEMFFMYGEDIDLSYRIQQSGYENWYLPVRILHYKGESTNKTSYAYSRTFYNAMLIFFDKHFRNHVGFRNG